MNMTAGNDLLARTLLRRVGYRYAPSHSQLTLRRQAPLTCWSPILLQRQTTGAAAIHPP